MINVCSECALRLFNTKHYNLHGIGNPYSGNCIVVPNVDYNAYKKGDMGFSSQVDIIKEVLYLSTGEHDNLIDLYIVPLIRCNETIACELTDDIYYKCLTYFREDVIKYNFQYILLLGDAGRRFLQIDIKSNLENIIISPNNRFYNVNYSPLIKYIDEEKFDVFKSYLRKWYYSCKTKYFPYKNYIKL